MVAGYSGKPVFQKLGLKTGMTVRVIRPPAHYDTLIAGADGFVFVRNGTADFIHLFCATRSVLDTEIASAIASVAPGGMLWVSWPKKSSKQFIDLTEDDLRTAILPTGWVDVKVCAVDADWSGLKFLRRRS